MLLFSHVCFISFVLGTKWHRYSWSPLFHPPWPHFLSFSPEIITILRLGYIILIHVLLFYNIWIYLEHFKIHHKWFYAPHFILQLASPPINGSFLMFTHVDTGSPSLFIFIAVMEENTTVYWPILFFGEHFRFSCLTTNNFAGNEVHCIHRLNSSLIPVIVFFVRWLCNYSQ